MNDVAITNEELDEQIIESAQALKKIDPEHELLRFAHIFLQESALYQPELELEYRQRFSPRAGSHYKTADFNFYLALCNALN
tara:strand:- start:4388 stop:4633 length:246 start_codon:yes stop_codon:yes gene_type:complete